MTLFYGGNGFLEPCRKRNPIDGPAPNRAGGIILWEYCSWPWGATSRAKLHSANPYFYPKTGCLIISAAWRWRVLHLDDVDTLVAKPFGKFPSGMVVGDQAPDFVKGANL